MRAGYHARMKLPFMLVLALAFAGCKKDDTTASGSASASASAAAPASASAAAPASDTAPAPAAASGSGSADGDAASAVTAGLDMLQAIAGQLKDATSCADKAKVLRAYLDAHVDDMKTLATRLKSFSKDAIQGEVMKQLQARTDVRDMFVGAQACQKDADFAKAWDDAGAIFEK